MRYLIVGGDAAGMSAAMQIKKFDAKADVMTLERGGIYSYGQCGLPYVIGGRIADSKDVIARSVETFRDIGIDAKTYHEVQDIDIMNREASGMNRRTGESFAYTYDKLLLATGGDPVKPHWAERSLSGVHVLKTIPDATAISAQLTTDVQDITIVGGGYIGLEMAENFLRQGRRVRLIQRGSQVGKMFDEDMADWIHKEAERHHIALVLEEDVQKLHGQHTVTAVETNKNIYDTDLVLVATGLRPNTDCVRHTDIVRGSKGAIDIDQNMQTNVSGVYAAGDCAVHYHRIKEQNDYVPLGTTANKQGRIAGMNMAGVARDFQGILGTSILQFMTLGLGKTGLSEKEASAIDIPYQSVTITAKDVAGYYPTAAPIHIKLIYQATSHRLLGGQVIGEKGVDKRIDVLATALYNHMYVEDLEDIDLSYAPPFNGTWDPIQKAARRI